MIHAAFGKHALSLPSIECAEQRGYTQFYKIAGKVFAVTCKGCTKISFSCSDEAFHVLTESGAATPAPYLARAKRVCVTPDDLPAAKLRGRVTQA
ncbi:MmcQ/YjbR family DNA-binding protein [Hyphomonas sp.]|jgi:predicted DNA-binding protein (MmcQ/YjbR family)|uniref:MmcQ/YjbR family DNA-binding protein n=1 Tax=Hyphomonas sp. TaxID=87 RepID=UPI0037BF1C84